MSPRQLIVKLLDRFERTDAYADLLLDQELKKNKVNPKDSALIQEIFFGVIRWRNRLNWIIKHLYQGSLKKAPRFVGHILHISIYQLIFLDNIPDYAVINEAVAIAKSKGSVYWGKKINAILRIFQQNQYAIPLPDRTKNPTEYIAVKYSHPEWMVKRWIKRWDEEETISLCEFNNKNPKLSLRVNSLKAKTKEVLKLLAAQNYPATRSPYIENFLLAEKLPELSQFEPFQHGLFSIQDVSAGLACKLLDPQPEDTILDLCSAPGGKATFIAELTGGGASIIAVDRNYSRLKLVRQNCTRLELNSIFPVQADGIRFNCKNINKIILDAPCSGLGVLAKRVDLRWKRTTEQIQELSQLQRKLIYNTANLLNPGGVLVYCTCTIEPEENERIIEQFLAENKNFEIQPASEFVPKETTDSNGFIYTFPHRHGIDGSFAARLVRVP